MHNINGSVTEMEMIDTDYFPPIRGPVELDSSATSSKAIEIPDWLK